MSATSDLLDALALAFREFRSTGAVTVKDVRCELPLEHPGLDGVEGFLPFCRAYLRLNPVVTAGFGMGQFGVVLADGRHLALADNTTASMTGGRSKLATLITGRGMLGPHDALPPADEIPITKGA